MAIRILFLFLLNITIGYSQNITIKGIALDSTLGKKKVSISINDTIIKFVKKELSNPKMDSSNSFDIVEVLRKKYTTKTNRNGKFTIKAKLTDTLYFYSQRHFTQKHLVSDLLKKNINIQLKPEKCMKFIKCNDTIKSLRFIGKVINVTSSKRKYYCNIVILGSGNNSKYNIKYKIIKLLDGSFKSDTINISTYIKNEKSLSFDSFHYVVRKNCDVLNNDPDFAPQITDIYINNKDQWIVPYQALVYKRLDSSKTTIRPKRITLKKPLKRNVTNWNKLQYPKPYYKVENNELFALFGNTLEEYLELKKNRKQSPSIEKILDSLGFNKLKTIKN